MNTNIVLIHWDSTRQTFYSSCKPPVQLHICRESRYEALTVYTPCFAPSRELAKIYFSFTNDILLIDWASLGTPPGRIGSKIAVQELQSVRRLVINEEALIIHAIANMKELARFEGITNLVVLCDAQNPQSGTQFGMFDIPNYEAELGYDSDRDCRFGYDSDESGEDRVEKQIHEWPELVCLREHEDGKDCSRHWWFSWWNMMGRYPQQYKWTKALADCLLLTLGPEPSYVDRDSEDEEAENILEDDEWDAQLMEIANMQDDL